jgi:hypothetical protein
MQPIIVDVVLRIRFETVGPQDGAEVVVPVKKKAAQVTYFNSSGENVGVSTATPAMSDQKKSAEKCSVCDLPRKRRGELCKVHAARWWQAQHRGITDFQAWCQGQRAKK